MPEPTKRLSWRTKKPQFYQSFGCGQIHCIAFVGTCESCGRSVYAHGCNGPEGKHCGDFIEDDPDERGAIPEHHCRHTYRAKEYGMVGRDVIVCAGCANDGDKYRSIIAAAKSSGTWTTTPAQKRLQLVTGKPFAYQCVKCNARGWAGDGSTVFADLNGEPFKAYYCAACTIAELEQQMEACNQQADIGTPEHKKRFALKDRIFDLRKQLDLWPANTCPKCYSRAVIGPAGCCKRTWHHLYDCCLHCGNDERKG